MKKITTLILAIILIFSLCSFPVYAESPDASKDPTVFLTFGGTSAAEDIISLAMQRIADLAAERSGGTIKISVYPASQLGDAVAQMESMIAGGQDMMVEAEGSYIQQYGIKDAAVNSFGLVRDQELLSKELKSDFWHDLENQFYETTGVRTLANNYVRIPTVIASKTPIRTIEDCAGVKLRVVPSKATTAVFDALGFSTTPVAYSEVYLSLQQNVIDATIASFDGMYTMGFYEVAPYITKYGNSCTNFAIWINGAKFDSLTEAQQQILTEVCSEVGEWYVEQANGVLDSYIEEMVSKGTEIIEVDQEFVDAAAERLYNVAMQFEADGFWSEGTYQKLADLLAE